ncbi:MAG: poly(3-hydroxybutyrate) depolymerase [Gammaproteobacteria bacterium]|nr:poly(3-hydroxybutyrate) depolymerase [Gammaproteobacteria bacterium]
MADYLRLSLRNCAPGTAARSAGWSALALCYGLLVALVLAGLGWIYLGFTYRGDHLRASDYHYPADYRPACAGGLGAVADHERALTAAGLHFSVTTPRNYRADFAHPLLVVWAPSGLSEQFSERFTGLTGAATERGFIVVYSRSVPLGEKALRALAEIPAAAMARWCIDPARVAYTGHSDGGTVSNALAVLPGLDRRPAVIAPSAMGMQGQDMAAFACPAPTPVMLMHNQDDHHFPDYGVGVANWWARCNGCSTHLDAAGFPDCEAFSGCVAPTLLCRAPGGHAHWPGFEHRVIEFIDGVMPR